MQSSMSAGGPIWVDASLCSQTDSEEFFPEKGGSSRAAKQVCSRCEVRAECLDWALENDVRHGIWGGLSERERRGIQTLMAREAREGKSESTKPGEAA